MASKKNIQHFFAITSLFIVLLVIFFSDVTLLGKTFKATTMIAQSMPYGPYGQGGNHGPSCHTFLRESASIEEPFYQFMKTNLQQGIFPLWNPHQCCGTPTSLMMEAGTFFPLTLIPYVFPSTISFDVLVLARMLAAGLLMYWLMYVWGFGFLARVAAGLTVMFTGPMVTFHLWFINVDLILPLLFLTSFKASARGTLQNYAFFSLAIALSVLGGHIEHIFYTHFLLLTYILFLMAQQKGQTMREQMRFIKNFVLFYFLGLGMAAVALLPFLADFRHAWSPHTTACGTSVLVSAADWVNRLITIMVPTFFKEVLVSLGGDTYHWGGGYLGALVVTLCLAGLWLNKQRPLVLFFSIAAFIAYGMSSGAIYTKWIGFLPIFNMMYTGIHVIHLFIFLFAFLVGAGVEEIMMRPEASLKRILGIIGGLILFIVIYLWSYRSVPFFPQALRASCLTLGVLVAAGAWLGGWILAKKKNPAVIIGGLLVFLVIELFIYNPRYRPQRFDSFPKVPYIEFLKTNTQAPAFRTQGLFLAFYRNTAMAYGVDSFTGSQALYPERHVQFVRHLINPGLLSAIGGPKPASTEGFESDLLSHSAILALANVNYFVLPAQSQLSPQAVYDVETQILPLSSLFPLPSAIPRAYVVYDWMLKSPGQEKEILDLIRDKPLQAISKVIIEAVPEEARLSPQGFAGKGIVPAEEQKRWANGVIVKAYAEQPCFLVLLDAYFPGWKAWVDGQPAKIYAANYLFRAVFLSPGEHVVTFRFVPFWFYLGLAITLVSFAFCFYFLTKPKA